MDINISKTWENDFNWRAAVCCLFACFILFIRNEAPANSGESETIKQQFDYVYSDSSVNEPAQFEQMAVEWKPLNPEKNALKPRDGSVLWLRFKIHSTKHLRDPVLMFERLQLRFRYFHENKLLSSFGEGVPYPGQPVHFLPVPQSDGPVVGYLRVESSLPRIGPRGPVYLGSRAKLTVQLVKKDSTDLFVISVLMLIGVSGLVLFSFYRSVKTYLNLACFALASNAYFVGRLPSKVIYDIDPVLSGFVGLCGLYSAPFFFLRFFREIFSVRAHVILGRLQWLSGAFIVFSVVFSLVTPSGPLNLLLPFYLVAISVFSYSIFFAVRKLSQHSYVGTFFTGVVVLFCAGLWEVGREFRLFNANIPMITWGFLGFVGSLVVIQGRYFTGLFQQVVDSGLAKEEARLRLERVLNSTLELSQTRTYTELIQAFADSLVVELKLANEDVTIDFFMPPRGSDANQDLMLQFSYMYVFEEGRGKLFAVSDRMSSGDSGDEGSERRRKIASVRNDEINSFRSELTNTAAPDAVLTIPIETLSALGAVTIRRFSKGGFNSSDLNHVRKFVNSLSSSLQIALQNLDYVAEVKARVIMENEMDAAVSLQAALLPQPLELPGVQYSAFCKSAGRTGGDWHGYYHCAEQNRLFLTIGDVTGHDFAASIMTGVAAGAVKAWEQNDAKRFSDGKAALEDLAALVNRVFCGSNRGLKFMSMFFACIDLDDGNLHIVNAGHPQPFRISKQDGISPLVSSGHILGHSEESHFHAETIQLEEGDTVFFFTDGLFENHGSTGACLSRRSLVSSLGGKEDAQDVLESVLAKAQIVWGEQAAEDDVTLVAVTWKEKSAISGRVA
ncbi:MAG: SpoIIE family protein phosphatase [Silvanigrellaceae bacterium]